MTTALLLGLACATVALVTGGALLRAPTRMSGCLLILAGAALAGALVRPTAGALVFTLSLLVAGLAPVAVGAAGAAWPVVPVGARDARIVVGSVVGVFVLGELLPALTFDPVQAGCFECPGNLAGVVSDSAAAARWERVGTASTLVWGPALVVIAGLRWRRAPALARRHGLPMVAAGVVAAGAETVAAVGDLRSPVAIADPVGTWGWWVGCGCVLAFAAGVLARSYRVRTAGERMARTVLAAIPDLEAVQGSLRRSLGDETLEVVFCAEDGSCLDLAGEPVAPAHGGATVRLARDRVPFAEVRFDEALAGTRDLVRAAVSAVALPLEYLAAQARLRAAVREVVALRSRIVASRDAERHRLERNLHDGAQQQLIGLGLMLAMRPPSSERNAEHAQVDRALAELRDIARGIFPTSLGEDGIEAALRELGDHTACALRVTGALDRPIPSPAGPAIYQLVRDVSDAVPKGAGVRVLLRGGGAQPVSVRLATTEPVAGARECLMSADDRFTAAGGALSIVTGGEGMTVEGRLPCAS